MAWHPIANTLPQYIDLNGDPYSGAVLKAYQNGTTTNINFATDATGGTLASSIALNASGYPEISGSAVIPHVNESYKLSLYPTQAAADANTGALWTIDELTAGTVYTDGYAVDTGVANAYVMAPSPPVPAYVAGQRFRFKALNACTGASTLNAGPSAVAIKKQVSNDLAANDILADEIVDVIYDGTNFQLQNKRDSFDVNGTELILDADGDTSVRADTDDQIDWKVGGTDTMQLTGAQFQVDPSTTVDLQTGGTSRLTLTSAAANFTVEPQRGGLPYLLEERLEPTQTAANVATISFTIASPSTYARFKVVFDNVVPATDNATLRLRIGDGLVDTGANYHESTTGRVVTGVGTSTDVSGGTSGSTDFKFAYNTSNVTGRGGVSGFLLIQPKASAYTRVWGPSTSIETGGFLAGIEYHGLHVTNTPELDTLEFRFSAGNITEGDFTLYGIRL